MRAGMTNQPFNNDTDQQTRRQVLKDTYLSRAQADADMAAGGRFAKPTPKLSGVPQYPPQPPTSHWAGDVVPTERPLGIDVNALERQAPTELPVVERALKRGEASNISSASPRSFRRRV